MAIEIWKPVVGFEKLYCVSNFGNIKSKKSDKLLKKVQHCRDKYYQVCLYKNKKNYTLKVHQIVAKSFPEICGNYFENCCVDHIDGNRLNNNADNLKVCSYLENNNNPITLQKLRKAIIKINERKRKPVYQYDKNNNLINEYISVTEASKKTNILRTAIDNCVNKRSNTAGGYIWKYKEVC